MKTSNSEGSIINMISLINLLKNNKQITSQLIADTLNISQRQAQRYLSLLLENSFLLQTAKDRYTYLSNAKYADTLFTKDDQILLYTMLEAGSSIASDDMKPKIERLKSVFALGRDSDVLKKNNTNSITYESIKNTMLFFNKVIRSRVAVKFYYSRTERKYNVSPYAINFYEGFWYLIAGFDEQILNFRLDYLSEYVEINEPYNNIDETVLANIKSAGTIWFDNGVKHNVRIILDDEIVDYFLKRDVFSPMKIIKKLPFTIEVEVYHPMQLYEKLVKYTPYYEIVTKDIREFFYTNLLDGAMKNRPI